MSWSVSGGVALYSWQAGCVVAALSLGVDVVRLVAEWRRDRVVLDLVERAPCGTVVNIYPAELLQVWVGSVERQVRDAPPDQ
ncbi:hypothetical protein [Kibdelosporangium aridum]|nr:hypothetical protein [Kibdelosporangium aridum]